MSKALVLPAEALSSASPVTFPGFPGVWSPGQPIEAQVFVDAGVASSVEELIARSPSELEEITVTAGSAPLPERDNHVPNEEEAVAAGEKALSEMTHAELDAKAASLGIELPDGTKAEKVEALEAAIAPEALEEIGAEAAAEEEV